MTIAETAMRQHAKNLIETVEGMLAVAQADGASSAPAMARGFQHALTAIQEELADYLPAMVTCRVCRHQVPEDPAHPGCTAAHTCAGPAPVLPWPNQNLTADQVQQVLAELAEREQGCDNPEGWASSVQALGARLAYRTAQRVIRQAAGVAA